MVEEAIKMTGGCLCGSVKYRIYGELRGIVNCHCSKCRRSNGHYGAYTSVALKDIEISDKGGLTWFDSTTDETPNVRRGFCAKCGASLFWHPGGGEKYFSYCRFTGRTDRFEDHRPCLDKPDQRLL